MGLSNILMIPGVTDPVSEINSLLFGAGQQGTFIAPSLTPSLISGSTFGTGVQTLPDLSPRNNPFSQATSGNRAAWFREPKTGRRNLLQQTDVFDNAYWIKTGLGVASAPVVTPNQAANPINGAIDADQVVFNLNGGTTLSDLSQLESSALGVASAEYTFSIYARTTDGSTRNLNIGGAAGSVSGGAITVTGTWQRFSLTQTGTASPRIRLRGAESTSDSASIYLWGAQLELGSTATAYQRVTTAFDVTESGQRDCYGVLADGIDDFYQRAIDFSGTDKVTVFAAVRKLSDAAQAVLVEHRALSASGNAFAIFAPGSAAPNYQFRSIGSSDSNFAPTGFAAPVTNILTMEGDISGPLLRARSNGVVLQTSTGSQGTGNYANDTLNLFRRNGATLPFNGNLYALIVAGGSYPLSTIQRVERLLSRITPTVNL